MANQKADQNPPVSNPGTILSARRTNSAFITRENRPNVTIVIGRAIILTIGFIEMFINPRTMAKMIAPVKVTVTLGKRYAETIIANAETIR